MSYSGILASDLLHAQWLRTQTTDPWHPCRTHQRNQLRVNRGADISKLIYTPQPQSPNQQSPEIRSQKSEIIRHTNILQQPLQRPILNPTPLPLPHSPPIPLIQPQPNQIRIQIPHVLLGDHDERLRAQRRALGRTGRRFRLASRALGIIGDRSWLDFEPGVDDR